jgi:alpha-N-arabinofuranosidase
MYNGIHAKYPDIKLIASGYDENSAYKVSIPAGAMYDFHQYNTPSWFIQHWDQWDNWQEATSNPNVTIFVGEYSVLHTDAGARVKYPILAGAIAEAVYSLGMERNSKVVKLSSYAPSLANFASVNWTPNLFTFSALPSDTILSVSYYLQQLFNRFHGVETVPISHVGDFGPLYWGSSIESDGTTYLKVM